MAGVDADVVLFLLLLGRYCYVYTRLQAMGDSWRRYRGEEDLVEIHVVVMIYGRSDAAAPPKFHLSPSAICNGQRLASYDEMSWRLWAS